MKRTIALLLALVLAFSLLTGCANTAAQETQNETTQENETATAPETTTAPETAEPAEEPQAEAEAPATPKYVFMFPRSSPPANSWAR